jgi:CDP-glycerol glycerophosphotransferase (TagB/SpsB family)
VYVDDADVIPCMVASDALVTDHSSVGFEYCLLNRPIIVFDAPDLPRVARINPIQIARLRSVSHVVHAAARCAPTAMDALARSHELSAQRAALAAHMFYEPGSATERAVAMIYDLLQRPMPRGVRLHVSGSAGRTTCAPQES